MRSVDICRHIGRHAGGGVKERPGYSCYWGKAQPAHDAKGVGYHLLCYHGLDVAAVGMQYLRSATSLCDFFREALGGGISREDVATWVGFWLALHDVGKFADAFQGQRNDVYEVLSGCKANFRYKPDRKHDFLGFLLWKAEMGRSLQGEAWFADSSRHFREALGFWMRAVTGHHGEPPRNDATLFLENEFKERDRSAVSEYLIALRSIFPVETLKRVSAALEARDFHQRSKHLSWWMAGIAVLADWLGSNQDYFPYCGDVMPLDTYWEKACAQAQHALFASGVLPLPIRSVTLQDLFPFIQQPSPLQAWAESVDIASAPQIHLLEDVTGAGKTEAAIILAQRIMAKGVADGFYIGLPTMATANAMYQRVAEMYRLQFSGDASLMLASSQRLLVEAFAASVLPASAPENDAAQMDETATARCTTWLADHNKRALLAPAGVGTVDQAMLAALSSRHQSLRLLGLFRKALIIDEVHACDPYMQSILQNLLTFHATAGGSVILLSATLTQAMKQKLLDAFVKGASWREDRPELLKTDFPLAVSWDADRQHLNEQPIETREDVARELSIRYVASQDDVVQGIRDALTAGKCVCWIRNTVSDAIAAHALFAEVMPEQDLILFHARFALYDRLATEERILKHFGKASGAIERRGKLVVATQVVEQSLDADWDHIVSDIAPIDLLIQRAGRLQRHKRDESGNRLNAGGVVDGRGQPCLWVFGPTWTEVPAADWFRRFSRGAAMVYDNHGEIWRTARILQEGCLKLPGDARRAIDTVFGEGSEVPAALQFNATQVEGKESADQSLARMTQIVLDEGYQTDTGAWRDDLKAVTRNGEPPCTVVLARWEDGAVVPWVRKPGMRPHVAWAYSSLQVAARMISERIPLTDQREEAVQAAMQTLPDKGRWSVLLVLDGDDTLGYRTQALGGAEGKKVSKQWRYSRAYGFAAA